MNYEKGIGVVNVVIAKRHYGKSTYIKKELIAGIPLPQYIYDYRQEYYEDGFSLSMDEFLNVVKTKKDCVIVFEEATAFFKGASSGLFMDILTGAYHNRNFIVLVFHSIRALPTDHLEQIDFIHCGKTKDRATTIYQKFKEDEWIIDMFEKSQVLENYQFIVTEVE